MASVAVSGQGGQGTNTYERPLNAPRLNPVEPVQDSLAESVFKSFLNFLVQFTEDMAQTSAAGGNPTSNNNAASNSNAGVVSSSTPNNPESESNNTMMLDSESSLRLTSALTSQSNLDASGTVKNASSRNAAAAPKIHLYQTQVRGMKHDNSQTLYVDFEHVVLFEETLARAILEYYYRVEPFLRKAVFSLVRQVEPSYVTSGSTGAQANREFQVSFYNLQSGYTIRSLNTEKIGKLLSVTGTVTRTSEVRPELVSGTFQCLECKTINSNVEQQFKYTEPNICVNPLCNNRSSWNLLIDRSTFINWQKIHAQENANEIPPGSMPRGIEIIVRNDMVERAKPGDKCSFTGTVMVIPDVGQLSLPGGKMEMSAGEGGRPREGFDSGVSGLKSLGTRELTYKLAFIACMVQPCTSLTANSSLSGGAVRSDEDGVESMEDVRQMFTEREREEIERMKQTPQLYQRMIESMAPTVFGHNDVKAGIALMLFGGVHKKTHEGIRLRGDINVCVVGDPGTAKSQFLKYVVGFLPRSIFTSGKASSAAGLTASVVKDEETGEFTIEAGALMLADNSICAIDEFDKMDISDQVAIHEAMEQQTISISKAGIQATLNARTSILAAANPIYGRYDRKKSLRQNIAMSAPIMSRFDLFFVVLDDCSETADYSIARHILSLHKNRSVTGDVPFSTEQLQRYIRYARTIKPIFNAESAQLLVEKYKQLRQSDSSGYGSSYRMTVRQLESMIRLSEALARLHCDPEIKVKYVREACRLLKNSIIRVESEDIDLNEFDLGTALDEGEAAATNDDGTTTNATNDDSANTNEPSNAMEVEKAPSAVAPVTEVLEKIRYEDYMRISNLIVYYLRRGGNNEEDVKKKSQVISWYLETIESELDSEAEYLRRKKQVVAIIERLIHKDCVLIELRDNDEESGSKLIDPYLVVHPNYTDNE